MITEGSCDTEVWVNGYPKISFATTGINYILKYIQIQKQLFEIVIIFHNLTFFFFYSI